MKRKMKKRQTEDALTVLRNHAEQLLEIAITELKATGLIKPTACMIADDGSVHLIPLLIPENEIDRQITKLSLALMARELKAKVSILVTDAFWNTNDALRPSKDLNRRECVSVQCVHHGGKFIIVQKYRRSGDGTIRLGERIFVNTDNAGSQSPDIMTTEHKLSAI